MSGNLAFFPKIDPSIISDLDRAFRGKTSAPATPIRSHVTGVVEAVANAAASISTMSERISDLEATIASLRSTNSALIQQLGQSAQRHESAEERARSATERAEDAERFAADHQAHSEALEHELTQLTADLDQIMETIAANLGLPVEQRRAMAS